LQNCARAESGPEWKDPLGRLLRESEKSDSAQRGRRSKGFFRAGGQALNLTDSRFSSPGHSASSSSLGRAFFWMMTQIENRRAAQPVLPMSELPAIEAEAWVGRAVGLDCELARLEQMAVEQDNAWARAYLDELRAITRRFYHRARLNCHKVSASPRGNGAVCG